MSLRKPWKWNRCWSQWPSLNRRLYKMCICRLCSPWRSSDWGWQLRPSKWLVRNRSPLGCSGRRSCTKHCASWIRTEARCALRKCYWKESKTLRLSRRSDPRGWRCNNSKKNLWGIQRLRSLRALEAIERRPADRALRGAALEQREEECIVPHPRCVSCANECKLVIVCWSKDWASPPTDRGEDALAGASNVEKDGPADMIAGGAAVTKNWSFNEECEFEAAVDCSAVDIIRTQTEKKTTIDVSVSEHIKASGNGWKSESVGSSEKSGPIGGEHGNNSGAA
jgi:hypothetical protein